MPIFVRDTVYVLALQGFVARTGYAAQAGELVKVTPEVANRAIAAGQARLPTQDDLRNQPLPDPAPDQVQTRDPVPVHRDPVPTHRDPSMPRKRKR